MGGDFGATVVTQLSEEECEQRMKEVPLWAFAPDRKSISRTFVAKNFAEGLKFFNQIAQLAEVEGHHPDLHLTDSRTVCLVLSTSAVQGLSIHDFNLAIKIDKNEVEYSPKWMKENPHLCGYVCAPQTDDNQNGYAAEPEKENGDKGARILTGHGGVDALKLGWPQLLPDAELEDRLKAVPDWQLSSDRRSISRTFQARNFSEGIKFFNAVAQLAEEEGHHPDLHLTGYRTVTVVLITQPLKGLSVLDITMAERINKIDVQYSDPSVETQSSLQNAVSWVPETIPPPEISEVPLQEFSPQPEENPEPVKSQRTSRTSATARSAEEDDRNDAATLLHSLFLIYSEAGATGLSVQEAVKKMKELQLPGLKERAKAVQIAKITRNHPDFVPCDDVGGFALRKSLLKCFRDGTVDPEDYADEKRIEATVFERYVSSSIPVPPTPKGRS